MVIKLCLHPEAPAYPTAIHPPPNGLCKSVSFTGLEYYIQNRKKKGGLLWPKVLEGSDMAGWPCSFWACDMAGRTWRTHCSFWGWEWRERGKSKVPLCPLRTGPPIWRFSSLPSGVTQGHASNTWIFWGQLDLHRLSRALVRTHPTKFWSMWEELLKVRISKTLGMAHVVEEN